MYAGSGNDLLTAVPATTPCAARQVTTPSTVAKAMTRSMAAKASTKLTRWRRQRLPGGGAGADRSTAVMASIPPTTLHHPRNVIVDLRPDPVTGLGSGLGGHAQGDTLNNIENVIGSAGDDGLIGNTAPTVSRAASATTRSMAAKVTTSWSAAAARIC